MKPVRYTLKNGQRRWIGRVTVDGVKLAIRADTKKELVATWEDIKLQQRLQRRGLPGRAQAPIRFNALCAKYLAQYPHSPRSKRGLEERLRAARATFGTTFVRDISVEGVGAWMMSLDTDSNTWRRYNLGALGQVLKFAESAGYVDRNVVDFVAKPILDSPRPDPFESWDEVLELAEAIEPHYRPLVRFAAATGLRTQEWRAIEWADLDVPGRVLHVTRTVRVDQRGSDRIEVGKAKTRRSLRAVRLTNDALDAIHDLSRPIHGGRLFSSPQGEILNLGNWTRRSWYPAFSKTNLRPRPPGQLRHTYATILLQRGLSLDWIGTQLGHGNPAITKKTYARWTPAADDYYLRLANESASREGLNLDSRENDQS